MTDPPSENSIWGVFPAPVSKISLSIFWPFDPLFFPFCSASPSAPFCYVIGLWAICPPESELQLAPKNLLIGPPCPDLSSAPIPHRSPPRLPTSVSFKTSSNGPTAYLFASSSASHLFSGRSCHRMPNFLRLFFKTRRYVRHFRHLVYRCMTDCSASPHHQHSADSTSPKRSRKVPIAPCQTFNW